MNTISPRGMVPIAALVSITTGVLLNAGAANAQLEGQLQFSGFFSSGTLSEDSLLFGSNPTFTDIPQVSIPSSTGSFSGFSAARIGNILSFASNTADTPFLDFGSFSAPTPNPDILDGLNTFTLEEADYMVNQDGANVEIGVSLLGFFTSADAKISQGAGNLTLQANNTTVDEVLAMLENGGSLEEDLAFSGALFTTQVPEPASMLGLGLVAGAGLMWRRRKAPQL